MFPALTPQPSLPPSWVLQRLERQVAALEATEETQSERIRAQQVELSSSQSHQADLKADFEARIEAYERKALEAERDRDEARARVAAAAAVEAKEAPRDSGRETALVAELEHLQAQLKQQQAALFAAEQQQQQRGLEAEWHKRDSEELAQAREQVSKLREEARRRSDEVKRLKEEIWALENASSSSAEAPERLQAPQDFAAEGARARQLEGLLAAAEAREARLKEELREAAEGAAAAAAEREGVTEARAPMSGRAEGLLDTVHSQAKEVASLKKTLELKSLKVVSLQADLDAAYKTAQVRRVGSPVGGLCRRAACASEGGVREYKRETEKDGQRYRDLERE